jgi:hypothetical protein
MNVTRRKIGSLCLASAVGLSGCTGSSNVKLTFVGEKPSYIEDFSLYSGKAVFRFNQLEMSEQLQNVVLVSESYGQLDAGVIGSGIADETFTFPNGVGSGYDASVGDTLYLLLMEGGSVNCLGYDCRHNGGRIIEKFELRVERQE